MLCAMLWNGRENSRTDKSTGSEKRRAHPFPPRLKRAFACCRSVRDSVINLNIERIPSCPPPHNIIRTLCYAGRFVKIAIEPPADRSCLLVLCLSGCFSTSTLRCVCFGSESQGMVPC